MLQDLIANKARPYYLEYGSHGWNHIMDVLHTASILKPDLSDQDKSAIFFHDSAIYLFGRNNHSVISSEIAEIELSSFFDSSQIADISIAIKEHSSSYRRDNHIVFYSSGMSELLSMADRGYPGNAKSLIERDYFFQRENNPFFNNLSISDIAKHALEYMRYKESIPRPNDLYFQIFSRLLEKRKEELFTFTLDDAIAIIKSISCNTPLI